MASKELIEIIRQAEKLTLDEQLHLIAHLAGKAGQASQISMRRRPWREIRGTAPYPFLGEDAQTCISRARQESDESRLP